MEKQQKLKAIEDRIRKDLPYLMELTKGCVIDSDFNGLGEVTEKEGNSVRYNDLELLLPRRDFLKHIKIVGHPIRLNDVLMWMIDKGGYINQTTDSDSIMLRMELEDDKNTSSYWEDNSIYSYWNLEKSLLEDQSEEFINFLYELL